MEEVAHDDIKYYIRNGECTFKSINVVKNDFNMIDLARKYIKERNDIVSKPYTKYVYFLYFLDSFSKTESRHF